MYKGGMLVRVLDGEEFRDIEIGEGEMYMIPGACISCASSGVLYAVIGRASAHNLCSAGRWPRTPFLYLHILG